MHSAALPLLARTGLLRLASAARVRRWIDLARNSTPQRQLQHPTAMRQLLVDVSVIHQHDAGTGIQRVVRSVLGNLQANPPVGYVVRCVVAESKRPYHYANQPGQSGTQKVEVEAGDVFLGLDLAAHLLPRHLGQLLQWKLAGASLHFVVYDMLPLTHAAHFKVARTRHFQRWAQLLAMVADSLLCISHSVEADLQQWLIQSAGLTLGQIPTSVIPLGGDFYQGTQTDPSNNAGSEVVQALRQLHGLPWALMVGTLEPRKCHARVLDAFEHLWQQQSPAALVLVGRPGWHTEELQQRITQHPQLNHKLYWFSAASDAELAFCYQRTTGVVVASLAEGYGLPLSEALNHGKPLLARDIPVFREVAGQHALYFTDDTPEALSHTLQVWLTTPRPGNAATCTRPGHTWVETTRHIMRALGIAEASGQPLLEAQSA